MANLKVNSEIGRLKTVLLHKPGEELDNLTPKFLEELLFDDIPWLPLAKKEHEEFADTFRKLGVNVVYLEDLVSEVLSSNDKAKEEFIEKFILEANISSATLSEIVKEYLQSFKDVKKMILKTMAGIKKSDLPNNKNRTLKDYVDSNLFVTNPIPNLYFTRDPFVIIDEGVCLNKMYSNTRCRETIYGEFIFKYHPKYRNNDLFYTRDNKLNIEGGDIMILNKRTLVVGISQRTSPEAIELLAKNLFYKCKTSFDTVLAFEIPKYRTFMHLDTVFTQIDYDKFTIHKGAYSSMRIFKITRDEKRPNKLEVQELHEKLEVVLEKYLNKKITLIPCGGDDEVMADREQWSDGSNTIAIAPGEVIAYERNDITNQILKDNGIKVYTIPSSELSRGRGGPRCMCMPLEREEMED